MSRRERIEGLLTAAFSPAELDVIDESGMHNVPKGAETHFKVVVVSRAFEGKNAVARHRLVYQALDAEMKAGVHALAITSRTPEEWAARPEALASPPCLGGSKR